MSITRLEKDLWGRCWDFHRQCGHSFLISPSIAGAGEAGSAEVLQGGFQRQGSGGTTGGTTGFVFNQTVG